MFLQTATEYSDERNPIEFPACKNKPLVFSRDDRSTVNRNHRVPSVFARSATTVCPFSCITKTAVGYYFAWPCKNIQSSALDRARNRRLAMEHLTAARNAAGKRLSGCFTILSTPQRRTLLERSVVPRAAL